MKSTLLLAGSFLVLLSTSSGQLIDSFDTTVAGRWGAPVWTPVGPPQSGATSISFSQDNGNSRTDWQVTIGGAGSSDNRFVPLQAYVGSYDSNWTLELAVVNAFSPATGQSTQIGLLLFNSNGMAANLTADYVKLVLVQSPADLGGPAAGNVIHYGSHSNTVSNATSTAPSAGSSATLKLSYDSSAHTIATYNGATLLTTYGIAGSGGDSSQNWGMVSGDTFTFGLYAQSGANGFGTGFTVPAGVAYADSLTTSGLTAIPEPSTCAVACGVLALGLAVFRRRRTC